VEYGVLSIPWKELSVCKMLICRNINFRDVNCRTSDDCVGLTLGPRSWSFFYRLMVANDNFSCYTNRKKTLSINPCGPSELPLPQSAVSMGLSTIAEGLQPVIRRRTHSGLNGDEKSPSVELSVSNK